MTFPFPTATIPQLQDNTTPPNTALLEISNSGVSENTSIQNIIDTAGLELISNKGAVSGYAGLDASQELLLTNFPAGTSLQILRRNAANNALEFADPVAASPLTTKGDLYTFDTDNQRLGVGTNGQILSANSAQATGLEWINQPATGLVSLNGDTTAAQIIAAGTGLNLFDAGDTHTYSIDSSVVTLSDVQTLLNKTLDDATNTITGIYGITGLAAQVQTLNMGNNFIQAVLDPVNGSDAATKTYVDNLINGLSWKQPARLATTGNITLSGNQTIDGFLTVDGDRVLVKDQTSGSENGVYSTDAGAWTRTEDTDSEAELVNMSIYIIEGTANEDTAWVLTTDPPIVVDTTVLDYAQVGAGTGNPLTTKGDIFGYDTANARIPVGADDLVLTANSAVSLGVEYQTKEFTGTRTEDILMGGNDIDNVEEITLNNAGNFINSGAGGMQIGTAINDSFFFSVNFFDVFQIGPLGITQTVVDDTIIDTHRAAHVSPFNQFIYEEEFYDENDLNADTLYASHRIRIRNSGSGTQAADWEFRVADLGSPSTFITLSGDSNTVDINKNLNMGNNQIINVIFGTTGLKISEDGDATEYTIAGGNLVAGAQTVTLPDLIADDVFAVLAFAQTLSNKTLGAGTVLGADLNASSFQIDEVNGINFDDGSGQQSILNSGGDLQINVDVSRIIRMRMNSADEYLFDETEANFQGNNIVDVLDFTLNSGGKFTIDTNATNAGFRDAGHTADPSSPAAGDLYYNTTSNVFRFYNGAIWNNIGTAGSGDVVGPISSTDNAIARFDGITGKLLQNGIVTIDDLGNAAGWRSYQPTASNTFPAGTVAYFQYGNSGGGTLDFEWNVLTNNKYRFKIAGTNEMVLDANELDLLGNDLTLGAGEINVTGGTLGDLLKHNATGFARFALGTANQQLRVNAGGTDLEYFTPGAGSGDVVGPGSATDDAVTVYDGVTGKLIKNSTLIYQASTSQLQIPGALILTAAGTTPAGTNTYLQEVASDLKINVASANTILLNYGTTTQYSFTGTAADFTGNNLINAVLTVASTLSNTTVSTGLSYGNGVKQTFNPSTSNAGLNIGGEISDPSTPVNGDMYYNSTADELRARINGAWVALGEGAEVTTWTADHNAARFNLENTGAIDFSLSGPLVTPASTQPYIAYDVGPVPDAMAINVPAARELFIRVGGTSEYHFTSSVLDVLGNQIENVSIFTSNAGSPATTGVMRFGNNEEVSWRNAANNGQNSIFFNTSNEFQIEITNGVDYSFSETEFDAGGNNIVAVEDLTMAGNLAFGVNGTIPAGASAGIWWDGSAYMGFNVPNADEYRLYINAALQYTFSQTVADWLGNNLVNVAVYESNATNVSSVGAIRLGDLESIGFRNSTNDGNYTIVSDDPTITFNGWETVEFPDATIIDAQQADLQILTLDMSGDIVLNGNNLLSVQNVVHDQTAITYAATLAFDFDIDQEQTLAVTGDLTTLTTSNRAAGKSKSIFITGDTVNRTLTFNGSWRTNPGTATVTITANTFGILTFGCKGGAETDVFCAYAEFA